MPSIYESHNDFLAFDISQTIIIARKYMLINLFSSCGQLHKQSRCPSEPDIILPTFVSIWEVL